MSQRRSPPPDEHSPPETNRRKMLQTIGAALAAASVAPLAVGQERETVSREAKGPPKSRVFKIDPNARLALPPSGEFRVFYGKHQGSPAASVVVVAREDTATVERLSKELGASPANARLVNGIVQVDLGRAAAGRCWINQAVARFDPTGEGVTGPITR